MAVRELRAEPLGLLRARVPAVLDQVERGPCAWVLPRQA